MWAGGGQRNRLSLNMPLAKAPWTQLPRTRRKEKRTETVY
jgi:hypothetical protein